MHLRDKQGNFSSTIQGLKKWVFLHWSWKEKFVLINLSIPQLCAKHKSFPPSFFNSSPRLDVEAGKGCMCDLLQVIDVPSQND